MPAPVATAILFLVAAEPVTFHRNVAPILREHCAPCHHPGQTAPFSLLTYDDARKHAPQIARVTRRRYMPPWLPAPGFGEFEGERRLTDAQIETLGTWAATGAREGPASDADRPPVFTPGWQLGPPDLVITAAKPFTAPADGPDVFWNFVLSPDVRDTRYVSAIEIRPGNARAVHHANLLIDRSRTARRRGEGFPGMDIVMESDTFDPDSHFLFWKPGGTPWKEPPGMAWRLDPANDLVLNAHLRPTGKPEIIQPSVGFYFTSERQTRFPMLIQLEHDGALDIPPGAQDFLVADEFRLPLDVDLLAIYPHAHYLGRLLEGFATLPDGKKEPLIRIPDWDLNWQAVYRYRKPMFLPAGTVVAMRFHYGNPSAKRVRGGNQSTDEMAHLWLQVLPRGEGDQRAVLQEALMTRRLEKYPADFSAHFNLGALLLGRKEIPSAMTHLLAALQAEPEQPAALNTFGVALENDGKLHEATAQFRHVLRIRPDDASAAYNLGQVLHELGDQAATEGRLAEALDNYRELVSLRPGDPDLRNNFGILFARSGDNVRAMAEFEAALKINPSHAAARRNLEVAKRKVAR